MGDRSSKKSSFAGALNESRLDNLVGEDVRSFKVVLLGHTAVGKSSIISRFVRGEFSEETETTIGAAFFTKQIVIDGTSVKFDIWDTAGQERYVSLAPMYYRGAAAAIVVYDQSAPESFSRARFWIDQVGQCGSPNTIIMLAGNKSDLHKKAVPVSEAKTIASANHCLFIETSAMTGHNIAQLFNDLGHKLIEHTANPEQRATTHSLKITSSNTPTPSRTCCTS